MQYLNNLSQQYYSNAVQNSPDYVDKQKYLEFFASSLLYKNFDQNQLALIFQKKIINNNTSITKQQYLEVLEQINSMILEQIPDFSNFEENTIITLVENYKILNEEMEKLNQKIFTKNQFFQYLLKQNFSECFLTIKFLDFFEKEQFQLQEFIYFYEKIEKEILYGNQQSFRQLVNSKQNRQGKSFSVQNIEMINIEQQFLNFENNNNLSPQQINNLRFLKENLIKEISDQSNNLTNHQNKLKDKYQDLKIQSNKLQNQYQELCQQTDQRNIIIQDTEKIINQKEEQIILLKNEKNQLQDDFYTKNRNLVYQIDESNKKNQQLNEKIEDLNKQNEFLKTQIMHEISLKTKYEQQLSSQQNLPTQIDEFQTQLSGYKIMYENLQERQKNLLQQKKQSEKQFQERIDFLSQQLANQQDYTKELLGKLNIVEKEKFELEKKNNDNIRDSLFQKDSFLQQTIRQTELSNLKRSIKESLFDVQRNVRKNSFDAEDIEIEEQDEYNETNEKDLIELAVQDYKKQCEELQQQLNTKNFEIQQKNEILLNFQNNVDNLQQKLLDQQNEYNNIQIQYQSLEQQFFNQKDLLKDKEKQILNLQADINKQECNIQDNDDYKNIKNQKQLEEIYKLQQNQYQLVQKIQDKDVQIDDLENEIKKQSKIIQEFNKENKDFEIQKLKNENEEYKKIQEQLVHQKLDIQNQYGILKNKFDLYYQENQIFRQAFEEKEKQKQEITQQQVFQQKKRDTQIYNLVNKQNIQNNNKKYSYDHLETWRYQNLIEILSMKEIIYKTSNCYSDTVCRLNRLNYLEKNYLIITDKYFYVFANFENLIHQIQLEKIYEIDHNLNHNYVVFCIDQERITLELYRKQEVLLFLKQKILKLNKGFKLVQKKQLSRMNWLNSITDFQPNQNKFGKQQNKTFQLASKLNKIGVLQIDWSFMGIKYNKIALALQTDFGLVCYEKGSKEVIDFIPLADSQLIKVKEQKMIKVIIQEDKKRNLIFESQKDCDNWYNKLNNSLQKLQEEVQNLNEQ